MNGVENNGNFSQLPPLTNNSGRDVGGEQSITNRGSLSIFEQLKAKVSDYFFENYANKFKNLVIIPVYNCKIMDENNNNEIVVDNEKNNIFIFPSKEKRFIESFDLNTNDDS